MENLWPPSRVSSSSSEKANTRPVRISQTAFDRLNTIHSDQKSLTKADLVSSMILDYGAITLPIREILDRLMRIDTLLHSRLEDPAKLRSVLREISEQRVGFDKLLEAVARVGSGMDQMELASEQFVGRHKAMLTELEGFASSYRATFQEWLAQVEKRMGVADRAQEHLGTLAQTTDELSRTLQEREGHAAKLASEMSKMFSDLEDYRSRLGHAVSQTLRQEYERISRRQRMAGWGVFVLLLCNLSGLGFLLWRAFA